MTDKDAGAEPVARHYGVRDLGPRLLAAVTAAGADPENLTVEDLAPVDAFHIRGREATRELASVLRLDEGLTVLDAGCGIGGTSRYLAATHGCRVTGVDLTPEHVTVAEDLTERLGLADRVDFLQGSVLQLPFEDDRFDVVWTEHVQMNIADKEAFYSELHRVLVPGGKLAFHDIFAGPEPDLFFPVPWATDASINHLIPIEELRAVLGRVGFSQLHWEDKTAASTAFLKQVGGRGPAPVGLHLIVDDPETKFGNLLRNLEAGRICVVQGVMRKKNSEVATASS